MLLKTHLVFAIFLILLFFQQISNKVAFIILVVVATIIPDLDTNSSSYGRNWIFRPLQFLTKHRGVVHSFTFAIVLSLFVAVFWPVGSFGLFVGLSVHLLIDSFTRDGVEPFWPFKIRTNGPVITGGKVEEAIFLTMILVDVLVFFGFYVLS